jgi:hypothetical protein
MAIRKRDVNAPAVQVPARTFKPDSDAVLEHFPNARRAAAILYDETPTKEIPVEDLALLMRTHDNNENVDKVYRNRIRSRMTAIRAFCVFCVGGSPKAVRMCPKVTCPLYPFRMGNNPFLRRS